MKFGVVIVLCSLSVLKYTQCEKGLKSVEPSSNFDDVNSNHTDATTVSNMTTLTTDTANTTIKPTTKVTTDATTKPTTKVTTDVANTTTKPTTKVTTDVPTTMHSVTTVLPPPTAASPTKNLWYVDAGDKTCIMIQMAAQVRVKYNDTTGATLTAEFNVPKDAKVNGNASHCGSDKQVIELEFDNNFLTFTFVQSKKKVYVDQMEMQYYIDDVHFPGSQSINESMIVESEKLDEFETDSGTSLVCRSSQRISIGDNVNLIIQDLQVQAFVDEQSSHRRFKISSKCDADNIKTPVIVPIIVGCILGGLLLIVILAFFIGKRRFANRPYEDL